MEIGVDIGGTFTDLVTVDPADGSMEIAKVPSTTADPSRGFMAALEGANVDVARLEAAVHGTTVAVNALIERKGCRAALLTSRGFRDVLELRRRDRPHAYGLKASFTPLIPRHRRLEADIALDASGRVLYTPEESELEAIVARLREVEADALVISLFNGYRNRAAERALADRLVALGWPADCLTVASDISEEAREFERTTTAAINTYVQPVMARYLGALSGRLGEAGFGRELLVAQSNGGAVHWSESARLPVNSVLSGPAAGVAAAARIAAQAGFAKALGCDIGGTSCDIGLIDGGQPSMRAQSELEFGLPIWRPMVDVRSIGAGGGSIAWIDRGGLLRVGPESAGAEPGPACYAKGGTRPTVTDAQLVLGRLGAATVLGTHGGPNLERARAEAAIAGIATALDLHLDAAAEAIVGVAEQHVAGALRRISTERGHDPRDFALVLFGGAGALFGCGLMDELQAPTALVPAYPGATSALGCLLLDLRQDFVRTAMLPLGEGSLDEVRQTWVRQAERGRERVAAASAPLDGIEVTHAIACCYRGQAHSVEVASPGAEADAGALAAAFTETYRRRFTTVLEDFPVTITGILTTVRGRRPDRTPPRPIATEKGRLAEREVHWRGARHRAPVIARGALGEGEKLRGPAIVAQSDATILVAPGFEARVLAGGTLALRREGGAA